MSTVKQEIDTLKLEVKELKDTIRGIDNKLKAMNSYYAKVLSKIEK